MAEIKGVWTAEDVALVLIDYQKEMFENVKSETRPDEIELNVRFLEFGQPEPSISLSFSVQSAFRWVSTARCVQRSKMSCPASR